MADLTLHPECKKMVDFARENATDMASSTIDEIRASHEARCKVFCGGSDTLFEGERAEIFVPSPDLKDGIPTYVYKPTSLKPNPAIYVYFHGGGFVVGSRKSNDAVCKDIASLAGCIVLNVEYRLAPEHKFPAQLDDGIAVMNWVKENKVKLGGTANSKVGMGGASAGGSITASVAHDVPMDFQVLIYGLTSKRRDYSLPSAQKYVNAPMLSVNAIEWFTDQYLPVGEEENPRIASILRPKFDHLPPALLIIAEHDPLYSSATMYGEKLKENGVLVETHIFKGAVHAFYGAAAICPTLNKDANKKIVDFIQKISEN